MRFRPQPPRLRDYALVAALLAVAADQLFFDTLDLSQGMAVPLFVVLVALGVLATRRPRTDRKVAPVLLLLAAALVALAENVDVRSLVLSLAGLGGFALWAARRLPAGPGALSALQRFLTSVPFAALRDARHAGAVRKRDAASPLPGRSWLVWLMPAVLAAGFVLLLGTGNPILERWLARLDPLLLLEWLDLLRILFWVVAAALVWPFMRPRPRRHAGPGPAVPVGDAIRLPAWSPLVTGPDAILRALVLFNLLFGVQTLLDAAYLWGGLALPEGIGHAAYAHRGAYTLMAAALLAAGFVLLALRPGSAAAADRRIRALVYLWIAQNVVLVLSAMLRLDLYVDVYALTHWRLAAFVWMGVVAAGLVLICIRIAHRRSNRWLTGANLAVLALVFAGSCFVDDDALIARFNVEHSRELSGSGVVLDTRHLATLGPAAIPAIDRFIERVAAEGAPSWTTETIRRLQRLRLVQAFHVREASGDWRRLTFRNWRLSRYLDAHPAPPSSQPASPALPTDGEPTR